MHDPLQELRDSLAAPAEPPFDRHVRLDFNRQSRTGVPEIVLAEGKDTATLLSIAGELLAGCGYALLSRVRPSVARVIREQFSDCRFEYDPGARMVSITRLDYAPPSTGGRVGIMTAGTSDLPVAQQARLVAESMGCEVSVVCDVGVAGLHRLISPLHALLEGEADVIVVVAGMDGALPSVVAGLVDLPVIGVPTSTGYGVGGKGVAALLSMLQTCAPGLTVVNVDNGVGAGASAARIANRIAKHRTAGVSAEQAASPN